MGITVTVVRYAWEVFAAAEDGMGSFVLLVLWEPPEPVHGVVTAEGYVHAFVSVGVYVVAAGWYAVVGVQHDSTRLTALATGALVLFPTVQGFAVFAPIITGATLFLVLGVVLLGRGRPARARPDGGRRPPVGTAHR